MSSRYRHNIYFRKESDCESVNSREKKSEER